MRSASGSPSGAGRFRFGRPARRTTEVDRCQVRSGTDHPCSRPATEEILGVPFCGACAREQEAYALMGDLAQAQGLVTDWMREARALRNEPLVEALERMQEAFARRIARARGQLRAAERETPVSKT